MSQKDRSFQSKPRSDGKNFNNGSKSGFKRDGNSENRGFNDRSDRGSRDNNRSGGSDRPYSRDSRPQSGGRGRPDGERSNYKGNRDNNRSGGSDRPYSRDSRPQSGGRGRPDGERSNYKGNRDNNRSGGSSDRPYSRDSRPQSGGRGRPDGERSNYKGNRDNNRSGGSDRPYSRDNSYKGGSSEKRYDSKNKFSGGSGERPRRGREEAYKKSFDKGRGSNNSYKKEYVSKKDYSDKKEYGDKREYKGNRDFDKKDTNKFLKSDRPSYGFPSPLFLYGVHAVTNALLNPERVNERLLCTEKSNKELEPILEKAKELEISLPKIIIVEKEDIDRLLPKGSVHQDLLLDSNPLEETYLKDLLIKISVESSEDVKVLVLDQVTDPHNIGAIMRSAAAFGASAIVMQKLHAPEITGVLAKTASGALEHIPLIREVNLSRALEQLKEAGFFCIGLDEEGKQNLAELKLSGKTALVLGSEGDGIRRLVAKNCDELVKLPTCNPIGSLNVSNAAAIALYELAR